MSTKLYLGIRALVAMLWTGALTLLIVGTGIGYGERLPYFAWCMACCFGASVVSGWLIVEYVVRREVTRNSKEIAAAVGVAVGEHLARRGSGRQSVTRIR
jgi:hypothetical protein